MRSRDPSAETSPTQDPRERKPNCGHGDDGLLPRAAKERFCYRIGTWSEKRAWHGKCEGKGTKEKLPGDKKKQGKAHEERRQNPLARSEQLPIRRSSCIEGETRRRRRSMRTSRGTSERTTWDDACPLGETDLSATGGERTGDGCETSTCSRKRMSFEERTDVFSVPSADLFVLLSCRLRGQTRPLWN